VQRSLSAARLQRVRDLLVRLA